MSAKTEDKSKSGKGRLHAVEDRNGKKIEVDAETGEVKGTGKTLEELASEANQGMGFLKGSNPQLTLEVGGKPPTGSELKIKASTFPIDGQFPKNKRIKIEMEIEVEAVTVKTERDSDDYIVGHTRVHTARVNGIQAA